jgi:hypothetical protein
MNDFYGLYSTVDDRDLTRTASERYALLQISADRRSPKPHSLTVPGGSHPLLVSLRSRFGRRTRAWSEAA